MGEIFEDFRVSLEHGAPVSAVPKNDFLHRPASNPAARYAPPRFLDPAAWAPREHIAAPRCSLLFSSPFGSSCLLPRHWRLRRGCDSRRGDIGSDIQPTATLTARQLLPRKRKRGRKFDDIRRGYDLVTGLACYSSRRNGLRSWRIQAASFSDGNSFIGRGATQLFPDIYGVSRERPGVPLIFGCCRVLIALLTSSKSSHFQISGRVSDQCLDSRRCHGRRCLSHAGLNPGFATCELSYDLGIASSLVVVSVVARPS
ncbi:uncharacterized protein [Dermacentor albipictus]|uniref:uncharacterized protein n=1 Tax=Dermacentor albipictus TaxID=60249 RepID=UPI0038FD308A